MPSGLDGVKAVVVETKTRNTTANIFDLISRTRVNQYTAYISVSLLEWAMSLLQATIVSKFIVLIEP